ncbi:hypothetical protein CEXT_30301 [Caerostris extrusa]|uniref:Uncharacterized protein n=1 Tax=Caerostris extrusa TaxID=172846 RepID=A0AAV4T192_CAEEX|nr:hypothetical protein CEXT_30301 [Caerostris extrusa]
MSSLRHPNSIAVAVTDKTTAGEVVESGGGGPGPDGDPSPPVLRFARTAREQGVPAEAQDHVEPIVMSHRCLLGTKKTGDTLRTTTSTSSERTWVSVGGGGHLGGCLPSTKGSLLFFPGWMERFSASDGDLRNINVCERRLDHNISIQNLTSSGSGRFASGTTWEIRCHH